MSVDEAVNGIEAIELYKKNSYDLLLIDLEMPEMDGVAVAADVRKKTTKYRSSPSPPRSMKTWPRT